MQSPYITVPEIAALHRVQPKTIHRWNCVNKKTGKKYRPDFPDPVYRGKWLASDIYRHAGINPSQED